ncbi:quinone oxidoreductase family protein [Flindersiella endophytica]
MNERTRVVYDQAAPEGVRLVRELAPAPGEGEVLLAVRYAALNAADLHRRDERGPGIEVAGTVVVGAGALPGAWLFGLVDRGGLSDLVLARTDLLTPVPVGLDEQAAAAAPEAFIVAVDALADEDSGPVLVTGASSGVGLACVQLAVAAGLPTIAVARHAAGRELLTELGAVAVDGPEAAAAACEQRGAPRRLVDFAGGPDLARYLEVLAPGAEVVLIGALAGQTVPLHLPTVIGKQLRLRGATMGRRGHEARRAAVARFAEAVVPQLAAGTARPLVHAVIPATKPETAFAEMRRSGKTGKVLITFDSDNPGRPA